MTPARALAVAALVLVGCAEKAAPEEIIGATLTPQTGQKSLLFYGNTNHKKLASVTNVRVFDPANPTAVLASSDDITTEALGRAEPSVTMVGFNAADNTYSDLYVDHLYYVKGGNPKWVSLKMGGAGPTEDAHSDETGLTKPSFKTIDYLGTMRVLVATKGSSQVIICPNADGSETSVPFANKTFLTVYYPKFGEAPASGVIYDATTFTFQRFDPPKSACAACGIEGSDAKYTDFTGLTLTAASKYRFLGDIAGTAQSALVADKKLYILDKPSMSITEKPVTTVNTAVVYADLVAAGDAGKSALKFVGKYAFYLFTGADEITNVYQLDVTTGELKQLTKDHGAGITMLPTKFMSATDDWIVYGSDGHMVAVKKGADKVSPTVLFENTKATGIRYPFNFGIGPNFLYVTYSIDTSTAKTSYQACVFDAAGVSTCKDNSFWSNVVAARSGKLNLTSDYPYTPYAYVRVDDTDEYGGGTLRAVVGTDPLDPGLPMGKVPNYNFNTFVHSTYYHKTTIDTDGSIVIYGKRDDNFVGDAFLVNLLKTNSVVNLTNEVEPSVAEINSGSPHCHGRYCAVCHAYGGGKIYGDKAGEKDAYGYNIKVEYADGTSKMGRLGKGLGENFSFLYADLKADFTPVVVTADGATEIRRGKKLEHTGVAFSNCDFCHVRAGDTLRYGAEGPIHTVK
jgi:hypothetical protein